MPLSSQLSRRERQIMDIVYELGEASAKDMEAHLANPPGYSAIRATMNKLETKGFLAHRERDLKYVYYPLIDHQQARESALQRLLKTFFEGSAAQAMSTLLDLNKDSVTEKELDELNKLLDKAKKEKLKK
ncbi:MAG: BlaI/MecI/CopY family transcriptional regulator [Proteobacteria bacterium]|jgi:BlaI family penicillinase repressor|nr:BlaI/MecI/CopY family transcriptional regulator [Pseudomonadota bacterium]MDA1289969.1 BlaI/MecI/CopY family transcriptional regulator [Pseudomonadota bacterium]